MVDGRLRSSVTNAQAEHADFGGIVPEVASRAHQRLIVPAVHQALSEAGVQHADLDALAVTRGPGLSGALLVGLSFAKALAFGLGCPLVGVNHLEGHLASVFLDEEDVPAYPFLCLIASGGHTQLLLAEAEDRPPRMLGQTRDDAAGEALDKVAQFLELGYPGGPEVEHLAERGDPAFHAFPRSRPGAYDFSFSGLKTSVLYYLKSFSEAERARHLDQHRADLCASVQEAVVDVLIDALFEAAAETGARDLALVGGVSANRHLRQRAARHATDTGRRLFLPKMEYCTDNAAMICAAAHRRLQHAGSLDAVPDSLTLDADPGLALA